MTESGGGNRPKGPNSRPAKVIRSLPNVERTRFWGGKKRYDQFDQSIVGVVIVRSDSTIVHINTYFANLIGGSPEDLLGKRLFDFVSDRNKVADARILQTLVSGERRSVQFESAIVDQNGKTVDLLVNAFVGNFQGDPAVVGVMIDISDRKQVENDLRASEAKYAIALEIMGAGGWEYDVATDRFTLNDMFYDVYRTTAAAVGGYTLSSADFDRRFIHPEDVDYVDSEVKAAFEATVPDGARTFEHRMSYGDGTPGFVAVRLVIVKDAEGRAIKTYGVNQDITRQKSVEQALLASKANLRTTLANMSHGLMTIDSEAKLVLFNPRYIEIYGLPPEQVVLGMTAQDLMAISVSHSGLDDLDGEGTLTKIRTARIQQTEGSHIQNLSDGRSIAISYRPIAGGGLVLTFEDITERLAAEAKIRHMANFDALTNLPNRASFYEQIDVTMKHRRRAESVAVLSLDLDKFKAVNDIFGHPVGDRLLQEAAARIRSCLRKGDIAARLGGDEFAILQIPAGDASDITALANRVIETVGAPYDFDGRQVIIGVSVGVAVAPVDGTAPDILMKHADLSLYRAKADGGSVCRFFEAEMDARMQARLGIELDLRRALHAGGEFELLYQPVVNVKTGKVVSCEALLRWRSPERGMVMPDVFIPVAEATGLIVPLGDWVLRQACADAARWPKHFSVAVNLSPVQFKNRNLVQSVEDALAESGLSASRLELEITELVLIDERDGAFATLHRFRDLGIRISMDDFGTGYSSLGYLQSFPFSTIKIDQSFIHDLPRKEDSLAIVRAVVGLSGSLGIATIAEGVETEEQRAIIASEGCNLYQGLLFSKPRPNSEVEKIFKAQDAAGVAAFGRGGNVVGI
ncbi:EAL domain-containing protein [Tropicimonas sp. IMCC34043]|uniref:sensor domain-containing protein n=1 Tax=Tropicimonas sp. IMCC34043 TaxID=2248760 RepID=UPI000E236219|nr:EAL domain-containing protein [Tropicimonas sp. IMCC34043]